MSDNHKPRMVTLDVLSQYIGHRNYMEFTHWLKTSTKYNSSFFKANQLVSSDLQEGSLVSIGWSPNRLLQLRYLGDSTYEIEKSENSKLQPGDRFVTGCFIKEQPLYLPYIERGGERSLFPELSPEEQLIVNVLSKTNDLQVNLISVKTNIDISRLTSLLFTLEMKGVIKTFAGGMYHLLK